MMRFRFREDEQRYFALLAELNRASVLISSSRPDELVTLLRNTDKLHNLLMLEGVRQGVALSSLAALVLRSGGPDFTQLKAFQLHAMIYGSADTPLRDAEREWLTKFGIDVSENDKDALDDLPMRYAPETSRDTSGKTLLSDLARMGLDDDRDEDTEDPSAEPFPAANEAVPTPGRTMHGRPVYQMEDFVDDQPVHSPDAVERLRDYMQGQDNNWKSWADMVRVLSDRSHISPLYIDIVLNTPIGRTMLTQCGVFLSPGDALDTDGLQDQGAG